MVGVGWLFRYLVGLIGWSAWSGVAGPLGLGGPVGLVGLVGLAGLVVRFFVSGPISALVSSVWSRRLLLLSCWFGWFGLFGSLGWP